MKQALRIALMPLCLAALALQASAQGIGLSLAQAPEVPAAASAPLSAKLVEGCLDALFDAGLIASDADCAYISRAEWEQGAFGLGTAREGMLDIMIAAYASLEPSSYKTDSWLLAVVDYRLVRVSDGSVFARGSLKGPADSAEAASNAAGSARDLGASLGSACVGALGSLSPGGIR